ncbi:hypothetical protein BGX38DRAFT_1265490 [Terfezia claveryi]|nr:hypothetical protein BGX38DRAFT_1265490 [Terfezia claveryi]
MSIRYYTTDSLDSVSSIPTFFKVDPDEEGSTSYQLPSYPLSVASDTKVDYGKGERSIRKENSLSPVSLETVLPLETRRVSTIGRMSPSVSRRHWETLGDIWETLRRHLGDIKDTKDTRDNPVSWRHHLASRYHFFLADEVEG